MKICNTKICNTNNDEGDDICMNIDSEIIMIARISGKYQSLR